MFGPQGGPPPIHSNAEGPKMPKGFKNKVSFIGKSVKGTFRRLFYIFTLVYKSQPIIIILMAFTAVFNGVQSIIGAYITKWLMDGLQRAVEGTLGEFWQLGGLLILQIVFQLFVLVISSVNRMITRLSNELFVYSIKIKIMKKAKTIDLAKFDLPEFYSQLENATQEAGSRPLQVIEAAFSIVSTLITLISFITVLSGTMFWAPIAVIIMTIPSAIITYKYRKKMFRYMRFHSKERRQLNYYSQLLTDKDLVKEVKLFDLGDTFIDKYSGTFKTYFKGMKKLIVQEGVWGIGIAAAQSALNGFIFLRIAYLVYSGLLTIGDYSLYTNALFSISNSVSSLITTTGSIYEGTLYIDNLITFMNVEPTIVPSLPSPRKIRHHEPHTIEFKNVSFSYPATDKRVLQNINLTVSTSETVVLVGLNGAGKTTLLKLLTRLYDPTEGVIYLDGHDIREYDVKDLYSMYGMIFQDFGKYAFSVKENIGFGDLNRRSDDELIHDAAEKSNADEFINKLPNGYDTPLMRVFEQSGLELSVGQWQKIAVARAFLRDSDFVILDEPTASLDPMAEQEIFSQFDGLRQGKGTIFVSHRLSSATIASKIIVLENGRIVEEGNHEQLMRLGGKYAELFTTQAKHYIESTPADTNEPPFPMKPKTL